MSFPFHDPELAGVKPTYLPNGQLDWKKLLQDVPKAWETRVANWIKAHRGIDDEGVLIMEHFLSNEMDMERDLQAKDEVIESMEEEIEALQGQEATLAVVDEILDKKGVANFKKVYKKKREYKDKLNYVQGEYLVSKKRVIQLEKSVTEKDKRIRELEKMLEEKDGAVGQGTTNLPFRMASEN